MSARILIINQHADLSSKLASFLHEQAFAIEQAFDGQAAVVLALKKHFDLILIGDDLPKLSALQVIKQLRRTQKLPIVVLADNKNQQDGSAFYQQGADDYMCANANLDELHMRVLALLRRMQWNRLNKQNECHLINDGDLRLNRQHQTVHHQHKEIELTPIQFRLLWTLIDNKDQVLSKPFLYRVVFNKEFKSYDRGLDIHISRVRKKLAASQGFAEKLLTVHGKGYCFSE